MRCTLIQYSAPCIYYSIIIIQLMIPSLSPDLRIITSLYSVQGTLEKILDVIVACVLVQHVVNVLIALKRTSSC